MQQIQQKIELFHSLSLMCMILFLVCLGLCIFFFFKFRIRDIFNARTGRSMKRKVRQMEERNAQTGRFCIPGTSGSSGGISRRLNHVRKVEMDQLIENPAQKTDPMQPFSRVGMEETSALPGMGYNIRSAQAEVDQSHGRFVLKKGILLTHTNEFV